MHEKWTQSAPESTEITTILPGTSPQNRKNDFVFLWISDSMFTLFVNLKMCANKNANIGNLPNRQNRKRNPSAVKDPSKELKTIPKDLQRPSKDPPCSPLIAPYRPL